MKQFFLYILEIVLAVALGWQIGQYIGLQKNVHQEMGEMLTGKEEKSPEHEVIVTVAPADVLEKTTPTLKLNLEPTVRPTARSTAKPTVKKVGDTAPWGVARQIDEYTWTMKIGQGERMATANEIFDALNYYRVGKGSQQLTWDEKLAGYAQERADYLAKIKSTDGHKGFFEFTKDDKAFEVLGFDRLGENISYGYKLEGVHMIEWMYAGDKPHDDNQLDNRWNFVGIGVRDTATALIFGTGKH